MQKKFFLSAIIILIALSGFTQELPLNTCGIVNIYDAAGNRTKRVYFCNNGSDPYPTKINKDKTKTTEEFQAVDALYPNPTTGRFYVTFSKALKNAKVVVIDANGKIITQFKASGNKVDFNLSSVAAGIYFVRIEEGGNVISKKVIKQ